MNDRATNTNRFLLIAAVGAFIATLSLLLPYLNPTGKKADAALIGPTAAEIAFNELLEKKYETQNRLPAPPLRVNENKVNQLLALVEAQNGEIQKLAREKKSQESELEALKEGNRSLQKILAELKDEIGSHRSWQRQKGHEAEAMKVSCEGKELQLKKTIENQDRSIANLSKELEDSEKERQGLAILVDALQDEIDDLQFSLAASNEDHSKMICMIYEQKEIARKMLDQKENEKQELANQVALLESEIKENYAGKLVQMEDELANARKLLRHLRRSQESKVAEYEQTVKNLTDEILAQKLEADQNALIQDDYMAEYEKSIRALSENIDALANRLDEANEEGRIGQNRGVPSSDEMRMKDELERIAMQLKSVEDSCNREKLIWQRKEMLIKEMQRRLDDKRKHFEANS